MDSELAMDRDRALSKPAVALGHLSLGHLSLFVNGNDDEHHLCSWWWPAQVPFCFLVDGGNVATMFFSLARCMHARRSIDFRPKDILASKLTVDMEAAVDVRTTLSIVAWAGRCL